MKKLTVIIITVCLCASTAMFATDGTWSLETNGNWSTADNWVSSTIADGAGSKAYFNNNFSGDGVGLPRAVTVDSARTIGEVHFGSSGSFNNYWGLQTGTITLDNSGIMPIINVSNIWLAIIESIAGANGFNKTGPNDLRLYGDNSVSGTVTVSEGLLGVYNDNALKNADVNINGGMLIIGDGIGASFKSLTAIEGNSYAGLIKPETDFASSLNTPLTASYTANNRFVVEVDGYSELSLNSNVTMTVNSAMAISGHKGILNINAPISGDYSLNLMGRHLSSFVGTFNINAPCTYTGGTTLEAWGANPRYEIGVNQAFPLDTGIGDNQFYIHVYDSSEDTSVTLDLNDYTQTVGTLSINLEGAQNGHYAEITGSDAGLLIVSNFFWTSPAISGCNVKLTGGKLVNNAPSYNAQMPLVITNATFIQNGNWAGVGDAKFELQAGGKIGGNGWLGFDTSGSDLIITPGATITPGNGIGSVGCWNLEMQSGSMYDWEVDNGTNSDFVEIRGMLNISGTADNSVTVNVSVIGGIDPSDTNLLFYTSNGTGGISGSTNSIFLSYECGIIGPEHPFIDAENNMFITDIVPEPGIIGLLSLLGLGLTYAQKIGFGGTLSSTS